MKKFKETIENIHELSRKEKLALDLALLDESGNDMCSIPFDSLRSKVMRDRHKKMCKPQKVTKSMWSKAAQKAAGGRHNLYNDLEEGSDDNLISLIHDITKDMIKALKRNDQRTLDGLYKNLGKVIK